MNRWKIALIALGIALAISLALHGLVNAQSGAVQRVQQFARANCARCHSIDKVTNSPLALAPEFRSLHKRYPVENLREALSEGIVTSHQNMPEFRLEPDQINDFLAFLKSLE